MFADDAERGTEPVAVRCRRGPATLGAARTARILRTDLQTALSCHPCAAISDWGHWAALVLLRDRTPLLDDVC